MDYAAGFVATQVHDVNLLRAEERIALQRAAAERAADHDGDVPVAADRRRVARRRFRRHVPQLAR
ncbi:MAG TPA: hypothetical protein VF156_06620 [Agromyces sp.]